MSEFSAPILKALDRDPATMDAEQLAYPNLDTKVEDYNAKVVEAEADFYDEERTTETEDPLILEGEARQIANVYLLNTAQAIQRAGLPESQQLWSDRFTQGSIELFGQPERPVAARVANQQLAELQSGDNVDQEKLAVVTEAYQRLGGDWDNQEQQDGGRLEQVGQAIKSEIDRRFGDLFAAFDDQETYSSVDFKAKFENEIQPKLVEQNALWGEWKATNPPKSGFNVETDTKEIELGRNRPDMTQEEAKALLAHEILGHVQRSINGEMVGDEALQKGHLPDYLASEEGVGVLFEYAVTGKVPTKLADRYLDVALALGNEETPGLTRAELFEVAYNRSILRKQAAGDPIDDESLRKENWEHVNRIYRGSRGDDVIGVFTKDIAYYDGFVKMSQFVSEKLEQGIPISEIMDTLLAGKFDPSNAEHVAYANKRGVKTV